MAIAINTSGRTMKNLSDKFITGHDAKMWDANFNHNPTMIDRTLYAIHIMLSGELSLVRIEVAREALHTIRRTK